MSLEPEVMSRACRHPRQICEQEPPTRYHHTDQVNEDTYQPNTYQVHQWGREGDGEKAEQLNDLLPETNCTSQGRNVQHVRFEKTPYVMIH